MKSEGEGLGDISEHLPNIWEVLGLTSSPEGKKRGLGLMVHAQYPSTWEPEVGRFL